MPVLIIISASLYHPLILFLNTWLPCFAESNVLTAVLLPRLALSSSSACPFPSASHALPDVGITRTSSFQGSRAGPGYIIGLM